MDQYERHVFDAIYGRRSIRVYLDRPVEHEKIVKLLQAGMAAPSACNVQPWEFIVVTDQDTIAAIRKNAGHWGDYNPTLVMVVCGYPEFIPWDDNGSADCCAAIENMLIAATAMGLGSVWIGGFDRSAIRAILDIPAQVVPIGVVYFGYPAEHKEPRTQYAEEAVYWGKYDPERKHAPRPGNMFYPNA